MVRFHGQLLVDNITVAGKKLKITDAFTWTILSAGMISYLLTKLY